MKKKIAVLAAGICAAALILTGCSGEISNDYISIKDYKGVEVEKQETAKVTDEDVEKQIQGVLQQNATTQEITDRAVESGDTATIDYEGKVDGEVFDGGSSTDYPLEIGSGSFIPGFEDGIIGHNIGETFDINVTFPEDYGNADMAGKEAVFTVTIKSISVQNLPELNDELVKSVSEKSKTVEEYRKEVKKSLEDANKTTAEENLKSSAWEALMANVEVKKYPQKDLKSMIEKIRTQYEQMAEYYQVEFSEFLQTYLQMDEDTFNSQLSKAAKDQVKQDLAVNLIAEKEKLTPTEKELEKKYKEYAEQYGYESVDALKKAASEDDLKRMATQEAVQDWVAKNCKQVEKKDSDSTSTKK